MQNLQLTFVLCSASQKQSEYFEKKFAFSEYMNFTLFYNIWERNNRYVKGQEISERNVDVFISPKLQTKNFCHPIYSKVGTNYLIISNNI